MKIFVLWNCDIFLFWYKRCLIVFIFENLKESEKSIGVILLGELREEKRGNIVNGR